MQLSPKIRDIRPFLWVNYHSKDVNEKFKIEVRYTSLININGINNNNLNENIFFKNLGYSRRQDIRYGLKNNVNIFEDDDAKIYVFV